jgi:hypothetical protein
VLPLKWVNVTFYTKTFQGNDLVFETSEQLSLPEKMKRKAYATLRITDVDMETKQKFA